MTHSDIKNLARYLVLPVLILLTATFSLGFDGKFSGAVTRKELRDSLALINIQGVSANTLKDSMDRMEGDVRDTATVVWNDSVGSVETRAREDAGDTAIVYLALAKADMRDSATVVWNDSVPSVEARVREDAGDTAEVYLALAKADMRDSATVVWNDSVGSVETRAREDAGDTAEVYLATARGNMADSLVAYTTRDSTRNKVLTVYGLADSSVSGTVFYARAGEALTFGDLVYWKTDSLWLARGDTVGANYLLPAVALSADLTTAAGAVGRFLSQGFARAEGWINLPIRGVVYVDTTAGGLLSPFAPTVAGMASQPVAVTVDSTTGVIEFRPTLVITVK